MARQAGNTGRSNVLIECVVGLDNLDESLDPTVHISIVLARRNPATGTTTGCGGDIRIRQSGHRERTDGSPMLRWCFG